VKRWVVVFFLVAIGLAVQAQVTDSPPASGGTKRKVLKAPSAESTLRVGSQIVDDSTKSIYGPTTTRWMSQADFFRNSYRYQPLDTSIQNYHRWNFVAQSNYFFTDLGHNGTAMRPIFTGTVPTTIGVSTGFTAYDYYYQTAEPRFFDTQSPYTRMQLVWGGLGRATTKVEFARNIKPNWNFGFDFRPILTDIQFQRRRGTRQTQSYYWDFFTTYQSKNDRYWLSANFRRMRHRVEETGGINIVRTTSRDSTYASLFDPNVTARLTGTTSFDQRNEVNLFHRFKVAKQLQLYHRLKRLRQLNWFRADVSPGSPNLSFYDTINTDVPDRERNRALDSVRLSTFENEVGLKGTVGNLFYYGFIRNRSFEYFNRYVLTRATVPFTGNEFFVGGGMRYEFDSIHSVAARAEQLEATYYRLDAEGQLPFLNFSLHKSVSKPSFLVSNYRGRFDNWSNNFAAPGIGRAQANLYLKAGPLLLEPGATYTELTNFIYFLKDSFPGKSQTVLPVQARNNIRYWLPEWRMQLTIRKRLNIRAQIIQTRILSNPDSAIQIPNWFVNGQLSYESFWFNKAIQVQTGIDVNWRSDYKALGYDPVIQQFFVQHDTVVPAYPIVDVFLNGKIKRGRFFIRYHNIVQLFTRQGYLASAVYPGFRNVLDFGFELLLFD
jgi:hypothetical protein